MAEWHDAKSESGRQPNGEGYASHAVPLSPGVRSAELIRGGLREGLSYMLSWQAPLRRL